jgi:hypothetical protein
MSCPFTGIKGNEASQPWTETLETVSQNKSFFKSIVTGILSQEWVLS